MQTEVKPKVQYKVIVIGQGGTGKTSIINRYVRGQFSKNYKVTVRTLFFSAVTPPYDQLLTLNLLIVIKVGVDFALKVLETEDANVHLQLWYEKLELSKPPSIGLDSLIFALFSRFLDAMTLN